jgi:alpha-ribazole phosphatase
MIQLCLVRHGQTDWNEEGRYQGQSDVPLNESGRRQAGEAAQQLQGYPFEMIYSSDLIRARETAEIIAAVIKVPIRYDTRLREINQGKWEGQHVDVIKDHYAALWKLRTTDPANIRPPGGETIKELAARVYAALDDIARICSDKDVLIISHGLALATILCKLQQMPIGKAYQVIPENAVPVWVNWGSDTLADTSE